jgi:hypothetical protein
MLGRKNPFATSKPPRVRCLGSLTYMSPPAGFCSTSLPLPRALRWGAKLGTNYSKRRMMSKNDLETLYM